MRTALDISTPLTTNIGTPQGCALSPLLFSIYVRHMPKPSVDKFHLVRYAGGAVLIKLLYNNDMSFISDAACLSLAGATIMT